LLIKKIKNLKKYLTKIIHYIKLELLLQFKGKLGARLIYMKTIITHGNFLKEYNKSMMMCSMDMRCLLGMGGPPM
jgi:hypothetical protein